MCFSFAASLGLGSVLLLTGLVSIYKTKNSNKKFIAYIPILFAIQQLCEAVIWKTGESLPILTSIAAYIFVMIAFVVWPTWIPYSIYAQEREYNTKDILYFFYILGVALSAYFLFNILKHGVHTRLLCNHIYYHVSYDMPLSYIDIGIIYLIPTIVPFFITNTLRMRLLGLLLLISCIVSYFTWYFFFTSIWCFFAAAISLFIYLII